MSRTHSENDEVYSRSGSLQDVVPLQRSISTKPSECPPEVRITCCRFIVDAIHPQLGSVFLFLCGNPALGDMFYLAACDEPSRKRRQPVRRKSLDVVKKIKQICLRQKVDRGMRWFAPAGDSAASSRSASYTSSVGDQQQQHSSSAAMSEEEELQWCELLLQLSRETTGDVEHPESFFTTSRSSFFKSCDQLSHFPEEVRRIYEWGVCTEGDVPLHVSLKKVELVSIASETEACLVLSPTNKEFTHGEYFIAYCDPTPRRALSVRQAAEAASRPVTPDQFLPPADARGEDILSPMTPRDSPECAREALSATHSQDESLDYLDEKMRHYLERRKRVVSRGVAVSGNAQLHIDGEDVFMTPPFDPRPTSESSLRSPRPVRQLPSRGLLESSRVQSNNRKKWDSSYL